ncbi:MAG: M35 family metallo-endopeptidase [Inhella sp.]
MNQSGGPVALVSSGALAAPGQCVDVRLNSTTPVLRGDVDVKVDVAVTNTCRHPVVLLSRQLPSDDIDVPAVPDRMRRAARELPRRHHQADWPEAGDHLKLEAGATLNYSVELTGTYDLSVNGRYAIRYAAKGHANSPAQALKSEPLYLWLEGRSGKVTASSGPLPSLVQPAAAGLSYTGRCSSSQISSLQQAVTAATNYASESASYLGGSGSATARYTSWFGAYSSGNWATARDHFVKARDAFQTQALTLDCSCKKKGTFAYVYPNQPYKIYVCGAFWNAPMTGTDSKGGTLVHEMMHFTVIAGTDDWAYGQSAAKQLAITDPIKALNNSDNHEYFAENTPRQN